MENKPTLAYLRALQARRSTLTGREKELFAHLYQRALDKSLPRRTLEDWAVLGREPGVSVYPNRRPRRTNAEIAGGVEPRAVNRRDNAKKEILIALERSDVENLDKLKLAYGMNATQIVRRLLSAAVAALLK